MSGEPPFRRVPRVAPVNLVVGEALYTWPIATRWSDMDADGRVNNAVILSYLEEARMRWLEALGLARPPQPCFPVVASIACEYRAPIVHPAALAVSLHCHHLGRSSLGLYCEVADTDDASPERVRVTGTFTWVWVGAADGRPVPVPDRLRALCEESLGAA